MCQSLDRVTPGLVAGAEMLNPSTLLRLRDLRQVFVLVCELLRLSWTTRSYLRLTPSFGKILVKYTFYSPLFQLHFMGHFLI